MKIISEGKVPFTHFLLSCENCGCQFTVSQNKDENDFTIHFGECISHCPCCNYEVKFYQNSAKKCYEDGSVKFKPQETPQKDTPTESVEERSRKFWDSTKCTKGCCNFDGYDVCLHKLNFGSVTEQSIKKCEEFGLYGKHAVEVSDRTKEHTSFWKKLFG